MELPPPPLPSYKRMGVGPSKNWVTWGGINFFPRKGGWYRNGGGVLSVGWVAIITWVSGLSKVHIVHIHMSYFPLYNSNYLYFSDPFYYLIMETMTMYLCHPSCCCRGYLKQSCDKNVKKIIIWHAHAKVVWPL